MNEDGYVKIVGRAKDMVIRGGENIYPTEVEDFLMTHPDVLEASVSRHPPPPRPRRPRPRRRPAAAVAPPLALRPSLRPWD